MNVFPKLPEESQHAYAMRLIQAKENGIYDGNYSELFRLAFDIELANDEARKRYYGVKMFLRSAEQEMVDNITEPSILDELELKKIEIQKEKEKNRTIKIELNKIVRQEARFEMFLDEIKNSIETTETPQFYEHVLSNGRKVGILGMADIHYGKIFESVNNSYSMEICRERLDTLLSEVITWVVDRDISYLHVINDGDSIEGLLRISQIRVLETGVIDSVIEFSKMMAEWLNRLSIYVPFTYHHVTSANHAEVRFLNVSAGQFPDEDMEKVIINMISGILKDNDRVEVPIYDKNYVCFDIFGKTIFAIHGHQFKGKKIGDVVKELQMLHDITIDVLIMGHRHHETIETVGENDMGNIKVIMLPAIMGSDNFSDRLFTGSKAGATLIEFDSNKKGLTTSEIILN